MFATRWIGLGFKILHYLTKHVEWTNICHNKSFIHHKSMTFLLYDLHYNAQSECDRFRWYGKLSLATMQDKLFIYAEELLKQH